jgi:hypothetical protein
MLVKKVGLYFSYNFNIFFSFRLYSFVFFGMYRFCSRLVGALVEGVFVISRFLYFYTSNRLLFFYVFDWFFRLFKSNFVFFFKVNLVGLGFNVLCLDDVVFRFYVGYSHYIYFFSGWAYRGFCNNKTKFLVVGFSKEFIMSLLVFFIGLRRSNVYKICGIYRQRILRHLKDNRHNK